MGLITLNLKKGIELEFYIYECGSSYLRHDLSDELWGIFQRTLYLVLI